MIACLLGNSLTKLTELGSCHSHQDRINIETSIQDVVVQMSRYIARRNMRMWIPMSIRMGFFMYLCASRCG